MTNNLLLYNSELLYLLNNITSIISDLVYEGYS